MLTTFEGWEIAQLSRDVMPDDEGRDPGGMAPSCGSTWYRRPGGEWIRSCDRGLVRLREDLRPREVKLSTNAALRIMGYHALKVNDRGRRKVVKVGNVEEVAMEGGLDDINAWIRRHPNCPPSF